MNLTKKAIGQAEQDPNLPRSASNEVMFWAESSQCNSLLFLKQSGGTSGSAVNLRGSVLRSSSNVLEATLQPGDTSMLYGITNVFKVPKSR